MTFAEPTDLTAMQLQAGRDNEEWFPQFANDPIYHVLALGGECGELQDVVKKIMRGSFPWGSPDPKVFGLSREESEAADVLTYLLSFCAAKGIDLAQSYHAKRRHNIERYVTGANGSHV